MIRKIPAHITEEKTVEKGVKQTKKQNVKIKIILNVFFFKIMCYTCIHNAIKYKKAREINITYVLAPVFHLPIIL